MGNEDENVVSTNANRIDSNSILNSTFNQDDSYIQTVQNSRLLTPLTDSTSTHTFRDQEKRISYSHLSSTQLTSLLSPSLSSSLSTLNEDSKLSMANLLESLNTFGLDLYKKLAARSQQCKLFDLVSKNNSHHNGNLVKFCENYLHSKKGFSLVPG